MMKITITWLLVGLAYMASAQTIIVKDYITGKPIEAATLMSESPKAFATTNGKGQVDLTAFKNASKITIRTLGYKTQIRSYNELSSASYVIEMIPAAINLDDVVISATRWSQSTGEIPSKIISITAKDVNLQNPQTAADLLGMSGKVFIQKSQQGGGSPMIRGFATNRLLYTVDGVRMNTAIFRSGNLQNVINLDPFATEKTEVLFGPGSVIYGSDAIGGVMSFMTLTPQLSLNGQPYVTGKMDARYSSANSEKTGHFDVNVGLKKWAFVTSFTSWDFDHLRQGNNGPEDYLKPFHVQRLDSMDVVVTQENPLLQVPSGYKQINMMQKVRFKPNANWDLQYGFHFSETSSYGRYDRHSRLKNGLPRYAEWDYGPQTWMMNNLSISHLKATPVFDQMTLRVALQAFEESRIDRSLNKNERNTQTEQVDAFSVNLDMNKATCERNTLFYGIEFVMNDVNSTGMLTDISTGSSEAGPSRYPVSTWNSIAAYVNDEYKLSGKFALQTGLRYNQFMLDADFTGNLSYFPFPFTTAEINQGALTGSIGGIYHPAESCAINANFGTAFRSPNVDDLGKVFDSEPGAVTVPNPDLKAEYAYNFDLGIAKVFGNTLKMDITGYYTSLKNALVRRNFQLNGMDSILYQGELSQVQAIQNAAVANVFGIQAGIEIKLPSGFSISSDLNYQSGEEELDDGTSSPSRHAAPLFGVSRIRYQAEKLSLEFNAMYQGEKSFEDLAQEEQGKDEIYAKDADGNNYSPSWYTLNAKALYSVNEVMSISAGLENLTDQRYRPYSSGISGSGRNFILSVRCRF